ncbi:Trk-type K+ transport system, membrane component [Thermanaerovibrio velox DSM 12556]|uniref:Trk-type K+ transport system, membrane component n=1 Tax=Thermanaerovibrio velox DSM 12556 TaxID=926567 RepID=H0UQP8_9BACT|nr:TrkH family potassium uptake protein [Thermanaerovibrio velox]EHM10812.1 Trk-type K+ transport system, membrane component [Thermanaerovibrio velox DSM 12556]
MRPLIAVKFVSLLVFVVTACMIWPLGWAILSHGTDVMPLCGSIATGGLLSTALWSLSRRADASKMTTREAFLAVTMSWAAASAVGAMPFYLSGATATYTDAFFEAMSGFTTTGSSVLTDVESLPRGILFWRSLTHWLGGMGIIVLTLAVLPALGIGGVQLFKAEVPGPVPEKLTPRVGRTAAILWGVYLAMSAAQTLLLLLGGMSLFDSLIHTFGTMATGGFSSYNQSVGHFQSPFIQWVIITFMFLAGANFSLHYTALKGRDLRVFLKDNEFMFYLAVTTASTLAVMGFTHGHFSRFEESLRASAFQVISILTTTGFATVDYEKWHPGAQGILFFLMFIGGCAGSTGGAIKNVRILVLLKHIAHEAYLLIHPRAIRTIRLNGRAIPPGVISSIGAFFSLYMMAYGITAALACAFGTDLTTALSGAAATLGNIGPGFGMVGPAENYAGLSGGAKWTFAIAMMAGRLELFTLAVLFSRACWTK